MVIFYSGTAIGVTRFAGEPEDVWKEKANFMLSYFLITDPTHAYGDQDLRFNRLLKVRSKGKAEFIKIKKVKAK